MPTRGGLGLNVESSPQAFGHALELGVTTLELDTQVTADGEAVVAMHELAPSTPLVALTNHGFLGNRRS